MRGGLKAIYRTAQFKVNLESVDRCNQAIEEFVECVKTNEPGRLVAIEPTPRSFPVTVVRSVEPVEGGSRLRAIIPGDPGGVFRLSSPQFDWTPKRFNEADYARLKRMLELRNP